MYDLASPASIGRSNAAIASRGPGAQTATGPNSEPRPLAAVPWANPSGVTVPIRIIARPRCFPAQRVVFRQQEPDADRGDVGSERQWVEGDVFIVEILPSRTGRVESAVE